jgi:hypothetical protein
VRRQDAAVPGLGALAELDLDHAHLRQSGIALELRRVEAAVVVAAAEVAAADLPDEVATVLEVIRADAALPRVVREAALARAEVQGADRVRAQRAEAQGRDVEHRGGVRLRAVRPADRHAERRGVRFGDRLHRMADELVPGAIDVAERAEGLLARLALGALVDQRALRARERQLLVVRLEQVLTDLGADALHPIAQVADDRIVAQHRPRALQQVGDAEQRQRPEAERHGPSPARIAQPDEAGHRAERADDERQRPPQQPKRDHARGAQGVHPHLYRTGQTEP